MTPYSRSPGDGRTREGNHHSAKGYTHAATQHIPDVGRLPVTFIFLQGVD
jgi:hypothetical protein